MPVRASVCRLPDDTFTRGDWVGTYGSYAHIGPWVHHGGAGWPVKYRLYVKHPKDSVRYWFASYQPQLDRAVPFNAVLQRRTMAAFDDHGEVYPLGTGPNLYVDLAVPPGRFLLSLYFYEVDWIQYRAYRVTVRERAPAAGRGASRPRSEGAPARDKTLAAGRGASRPRSEGAPAKKLASGEIADFVEGKYKRFVVEGPREITVAIEHIDGPNVVLGGVFLDELHPPRVRGPHAAGRENGQKEGSIRRSRGLRRFEDVCGRWKREPGRFYREVEGFPAWSEDLEEAATKEGDPDLWWAVWELASRAFHRTERAQRALGRYLDAAAELHRSAEAIAAAKKLARDYFVSGQLWRAEVAADHYVRLLKENGRSLDAANAFQQLADQYSTVDKDAGYALGRLREYLGLIEKTSTAKDIPNRIRETATRYYEIAEKRRRADKRGWERCAFRLAEEAAKRLRERSPGSFTAADQLLLARACEQQASWGWRIEEYVREYETFLTRFPTAPEAADAHVTLIKGYCLLAQRTNQYDRAVDLCKTLVQKFPGTPKAAEGQFALARDYYLYRGQHKDARRVLGDVIRDCPATCGAGISARRVLASLKE